MNKTKIVVVEGLDKTGKSTFVNIVENTYCEIIGNGLTKFSFPNKSTPIGSLIRKELESGTNNKNILSCPNFICEMIHFWMNEEYFEKNTHYIFDRYFISTMAYQAFYNDSEKDLEFIKNAIKSNRFLRLPTDVIMFDLPNDIIIERTLLDTKNNLIDGNDTIDVSILNRRREAYKKSIDIVANMGVNIHLFDDVSLLDTTSTAKKMVEKLFL